MNINDDRPVQADVHAGDTPISCAIIGARTFTFTIAADADAQVFARVAGVLNIANVAPIGAQLTRHGDAEVRIVVQIETDERSADMIRRKMSALTCIVRVECIAG